MSHFHDENDYSHDHNHIHEHDHTHIHDGDTHTHSHSHEHDHSEEHNHSEEELHSKDKEVRTLYVLLDHWIEHNNSHKEGFCEWARKAEGFGKKQTSEEILAAVRCIDKANEHLKNAKNSMDL